MSADLRFPRLESLPDPEGKAVLVRATLDLPLGTDSSSSMAFRRTDALRATLTWLSERGARLTVCGDAGGADPDEEAQKFGQVHSMLTELVEGVTVTDHRSGGGNSAEDPAVVQGLIASHDLFVNDSPQWSYLPLPSLVLPAQQLPTAAGRALENDLDALAPLLRSPPRPFVAVLGGDRSILRLHGLRGLVLRADAVLVAGLMALPLLEAIGRRPATDRSEDFLKECWRAYGLATRVHHDIQLPTDLVWADHAGVVETGPVGITPNGQVVDIGPETRVRFAEMIEGAETILWTGALGRVESSDFAAGTLEVIKGLHSSQELQIIGGDALVTHLSAAGTLPEKARVLSATDSALELVKTGDLPALGAMRR